MNFLEKIDLSKILVTTKIGEDKMVWKNFKYIYFGLFLVFILSSGISFYWMINSEPQNKPRLPVVQQPKEKIFKVTTETKVVLKEEYKVCQKYNLPCTGEEKLLTGSAREQLNGLTIEEISKKYAQENKIVRRENDIVNIITLFEGLCSQHKKIWHLGLNNSGDYIAVYYGPGDVQNEGGIYKVTEIPINNLPLDYQEKIKTYKLEFYQEEELIATLDSISEFLD
ncbi:MAG: hypothetical protein PWQ67_2355 [Clostridia bacterium]|jgi:hypothetical protein|nr:hypothetical protein [Clostridia bacterium]MDN5323901.1 hypothetical protein [Clostridia bacterium]